MQSEKSCGAIVFTKSFEEYKFLIIQHLAGHYGFPKGHVEAGETEEQTAFREIYEETGLQVRLFEGFRVEDHYLVKQNVPKTVVYFLAQAVTTEVVYIFPEIKAHTWATLEEALKLLSYDGQKILLRQAYERLRQS